MAGNYRPNYVKTEEWVNTGTQDIMVFYPTLEEMLDFSAYIEKCEELGAVKASGICKIVAPPNWSPRPSNLDPEYNDLLSYKIKSPVRERISKSTSNGAYTKRNMVYRKELGVEKFREMALSKKYANPRPDLSLQEIETHFWRNITIGEPIYGADTPGSCYEESVNKFNVSKLDTILDLLKDEGINIPGVTSTYLYFGMYKSTFAWHVEDCDLYSINYLHFGEPKFWYSVPPSEADRVEKLFENKFLEDSRHCKAYLRHKTFLVSISELKAQKIPYGTMVQYPGEFIITFPRGYHMGFNLGYNCAESTNFALDRWIDFGKNATICKCVAGSVEVDMRPFMQKFRPNEYEQWHQYWYGEQPLSKRCKPLGPKLPVVELPPIENETYNMFMDQLHIAYTDYNMLWQHQNDFKEECQFNKSQANFYPHCAVCQYFVPQNEKECKLEAKIESVRFTNDNLYEKTEWTRLELKESRLVQCRRCFVMVHADCLHVVASESDISNDSENFDLEPCSTKKRRLNWTCQRCLFSREELIRASINCIFCPLRGGALIPHNPDESAGQFVHVICALMSRRTKIVQENNNLYAKSLSKNWIHNLKRESPPWKDVDLSREYLINDVNLFLNLNCTSPIKCMLCKLEIDEHLIRCQHCYDMGEQPVYFHPSCTYFARVTLEHRNFPALAVGVCPCHVQNNLNKDPDLNAGEQAIFYTQNREVEMVQIKNPVSSSYCHVTCVSEAGEQSTASAVVLPPIRQLVDPLNLVCFSEDVCPEDIVDCECKRVDCNGQHLSGWIVTVRWEDSFFQGYIRQIKSDIGYVVESLRTKQSFVCSRKPLYLLNQEMPEFVIKAMKKAGLKC